MGLLQKALETYEAMESLAGEYEEGKEPLAPVCHIVTRAQIEITINAEGKFIAARPADKDQKIIIPVTEDSAGRTSKPAAHPLCEQIGYLMGRDESKQRLYADQLEEWVRSEYTHPKAAAVLAYVRGGTIADDLERSGIETKDEKQLVCWRVTGLGDYGGAVWKDKPLMQAYTGYYLSRMQGDRQLCMLTGENTLVTWQHLKGVFSLNGNAKIISANDSQNFTYRGRFAEPEEAAAVGYVASQKAHNALKWLVSTQGVIYGGRAFVCWNPQGIALPRATDPLFPPAFGDDSDAPKSYKNYREELRRKLSGYREQMKTDSQVIIASFDAATTGRLAITYYNELMGSDFLERLALWDETCCWTHGKFGVSSPTMRQIINFAFGTQRGKEERVEPDEKIVAMHMQRLISCRIDCAAFPLDIMRALVENAGNLQIYSAANRSRLLFIACAVIRKYRIDQQKEAFELALEPERKDRSYQWGRLLAVMEKAEQDTYDPTEKRETNAIRMQSVFVKRPGYTTAMVMQQLKSAYYPKLKGNWRDGTYYDRLIGEIMEQISQFGAESYNAPLTESYLLGYYLQKNAFYTRKENNEEAEDENDEI